MREGAGDNRWGSQIDADPGPRVYLLGLMGAGKTTIGTKLAAALGPPYHDNDALLEAETGGTAAGLALAGPAALHASESLQLRALVARQGPMVASVAASVADRTEDLALLRESGVVVYLRASPGTLAARISVPADRPWLGDGPLAVLEAMFVSRDAVYRSIANFVIDCDGIDPDDAVLRILEFLALRPDLDAR